MRKPFIVFISTLLFLIALSSCAIPGGGGGNAASLLPQLDGYRTVEGQTFTDGLTTLGVLATLVGQPELGAPIAAISSVVGCYQAAGAVNTRVYSQEAEPRHSGVVAVGDRNALANPVTFLQCVPGNSGIALQTSEIEPCAHSYTLNKDDNEFFVLYAGLTPEICQSFCANLEGCSEP